MKAFWWFEEDAIAGMARPGLNQAHWLELPFLEGVVLGWLGQHSCGSVGLHTFRLHLENYAPKLFKFYGMEERAGREALRELAEPAGLQKALAGLAQKTAFFTDHTLADDQLHFRVNRQRLDWEIAQLKERGIARVVSLTERHHNKDALEGHFELHHLAIDDLGAPRLEQVRELAELIRVTKERKERLVVHCLAGIGRTSTMIMGAHILLGDTLASMKEKIARRNPAFVLTGAQGEFLHALAES